MTQLEAAKKGIITEEMKKVAQDEHLSIKELTELLAKGEIVITKNKNRSFSGIIGIGKKTRVKVNANIGSSQDMPSIETELKKLKVSINAGTDTVMDLSTGGDIKAIRNAIINNSSVPVGTVPIYETAINTLNNKKPINKITTDEFFATIEEQAKEGIDFITVHCGLTQKSLSALMSQGRLLDIVSRGGSMIAAWMIKNNKENPLYSDFDRLLKIAYDYDLTLSLGDGMRPGCLADATDRAQIQELITLGELAKRAYEKNVQVMIEGPGHIPLNEIEINIKLQKSLCNNAPFYVLGPIVTDIAPGYDHITSAIGGALAAYSGADFLCYVTSAEHLKLPDIEEVKEGVIVSRIAAHAADIARGYPGAKNWDNQMARARKNLDWDKQISLAINPDKAKKLRETLPPKNQNVCSMCGELCAIKELMELINKI